MAKPESKRVVKSASGYPNIRTQLDRILASPKFVASPQLSNFLRYVVEESLAGNQNQIKQYTVGVNAFDRPTTFNPQTDPIVRIQAGRLRRALHDYYSENGASDPIYIDLPKGGYVPTFQHNEDSRQLRSQDSSEPAVADPPVSNPAAKEISIAVLPLVSLTDSPEDAYTADGLTEELAIALNRFAELTVIGPLGKLKDQQVDPRQIGKEYRVTFVLQGTVRRHDSKIRISPRLSNSSSGKKLWGETYEYDLDTVSLFEIEDQVTSQVVAIIADAFGLIFRELYPETHHRHIRISAVTEAVLKWNRARSTLNPLDSQLATEALRFHIPGLYWHSLIRAAILGQLDRIDEAREHLHELLKVKPDFPTRGREIMKRLIILDENVEMLWGGLLKARLAVETEAE